MRSIKRIGCLLLLISSSAAALSLGEPELRSALFQPLDARIPMPGWDEIPAGSIKVTIGDPQSYRQAGLTWLPTLEAIQVRVVKTATQGRALVLTSQTYMQEPILPVLLRIQWPDGELQRHYTLMLDPPHHATQGARRAPASEQQTAAPAAVYRVRTNDSLSEIAQILRPQPSEITVEQVMLALLAANLDAFEQANINGLRAGAELRIPSPAAMRLVSAQRAIALIKAQHEAWQKLATDTQNTTAIPDAGDPEPAPVSSPIPTVTADAMEMARLRLDLSDAQRLLQEREAELAQLNALLAVAETEKNQLQAELANLRQAQTARAVVIEPPQEIQTPLQTKTAVIIWVITLASFALLAGVWLLLRYRRGRLILSPARIDPAPLAASDRLESTVDSGHKRVTTTGTQAAAEPHKSPREILKEAEVFLQYGFYERGKEFLAEALKVDPENIDYRLELLKFLHAEGDADGFEQAAAEVRVFLPPEDSRWLKICRLGRELCPAADLFTQDLLMDADEMLLDLDAEETDSAAPKLATQTMRPITHGGIAVPTDTADADEYILTGETPVDLETKRTDERTAVRQVSMPSESQDIDEIERALNSLDAELVALTSQHRSIKDQDAREAAAPSSTDPTAETMALDATETEPVIIEPHFAEEDEAAPPLAEFADHEPASLAEATEEYPLLQLTEAENPLLDVTPEVDKTPGLITQETQAVEFEASEPMHRNKEFTAADLDRELSKLEAAVAEMVNSSKPGETALDEAEDVSALDADMFDAADELAPDELVRTQEFLPDPEWLLDQQSSQLHKQRKSGGR